MLRLVDGVLLHRLRIRRRRRFPLRRIVLGWALSGRHYALFSNDIGCCVCLCAGAQIVVRSRGQGPDFRCEDGTRYRSCVPKSGSVTDYGVVPSDWNNMASR